MATYPTLAEVNTADREQLARWVRFLKSPGRAALDGAKAGDMLDTIADSIEHEREIMGFIISRFQAMGGMTPAISKQIGWSE